MALTHNVLAPRARDLWSELLSTRYDGAPGSETASFNWKYPLEKGGCTMYPEAIRRWHDLVERGALEELDSLLAEDAVFLSPIVHTPQKGKALVTLYLTGAAQVLFNESFCYVREVIGEQDAVLEFVAEVDGIQINGVDMIRWNTDGKIVEFKVMLRPLKAIQLVHQKMGALLARK